MRGIVSSVVLIFCMTGQSHDTLGVSFIRFGCNMKAKYKVPHISLFL